MEGWESVSSESLWCFSGEFLGACTYILLLELRYTPVSLLCLLRMDMAISASPIRIVLHQFQTPFRPADLRDTCDVDLLLLFV